MTLQEANAGKVQIILGTYHEVFASYLPQEYVEDPNYAAKHHSDMLNMLSNGGVAEFRLGSLKLRSPHVKLWYELKPRFPTPGQDQEVAISVELPEELENEPQAIQLRGDFENRISVFN